MSSAIIGVELDASGVKTGAAEVVSTVRQMGASVEAASNEVASATSKMGDGGGAAAAKIDAATRNIIAAVQRQTAIMAAGERGSRSYFEAIANQRGIDGNTLKPYLDALENAKASQKALAEASSAVAAATVAAGGAGAQALDTMGMSARGFQAAMSQVPMQVQDIVVSLQGGQKPLTVMLQQGSQLAGTFNGVGNAAKAVSSYLLSMVTPLTAGIALAGALALAWHQGATETEGFSKALVMSGNAAGMTIGQFQGVAEAIAATGRARTEAVGALTEIAAQGINAGQNLQLFAQVAMDLERTTGQSVAQTAEQFAQLGEAPAEASAKLNEQFRYLTAATYDTIAALVAQGQSTEAARVAQEAFATSMAQRTAQVVQNAGLMERAWNGIATAAKNAWSMMLNIGRASTVQDQLSAAQQQLDARMQRGPMNDLPFMQGAWSKGNDELKQKIAFLGETLRMEQRAAEASASRQARDQAGIKWSQEGEQYLSRQIKMERELAQARDLGNKAGKSQAEIEARVSEIRASYEKKKTGRTAAAPGENEVARLSALIQQEKDYTQAIKERGLEGTKLTAGEKEVLKIQAQLKTSISGVARANKEAALVKANDLVAAEKAREVAEKHAKAVEESRKATEKQIADAYKQGDSINQQAADMERANQLYGKSKAAIEEYTLAQMQARAAEAGASDSFHERYVKALDEAVKAQERLTKATKENERLGFQSKNEAWMREAQQMAKLYADEASYAGASALERAKIIASRQVEVKLAERIREIELSTLEEKDKRKLINEATAAAEIERSAAVAKAVQDDWAKTAESINQSLTDALMRGFEGGQSFGKSFVETLKNMFKTLVLKPVISFIVQPIGNAISAVVSGFLGGGQQGGGLLGGLFGGNGGVGGMASNASSLWSAFNGGGGIGGAIFGSSAAYGAAVPGLSMGGSQAAMLAAQTGEFGWAGLASTYSAGAGAGGGAATSMTGIAGGVAAVAIPLIIGAIVENNSRDRTGGAAFATSNWRNDAAAAPGAGTVYNTATNQLPAYQDMVGRMVELGYSQNTQWFEQFKGNERAMYVMLQQMESRNRGEYGEFQALPNVEDLQQMYGDFYRGQGYADPQSLGWWNWKDVDYASINPQVVAASRALSQSIVDPLTAVARRLGDDSEFTATTGWANRGKGDIWGAAMIARGDETIMNMERGDYGDAQDYMRAVYGSALDAFTSFDLPGWAGRMVEDAQTQIEALDGDKVGEEAAAIYQNTSASIIETMRIMDKLGRMLPAFAGLSDDAVTTMVEAAGGVEGLATSAQTYVDAYSSQAEKLNLSSGDLAARFEELGVAMPNSRRGMQDLINASLELGEEGAATAAGLLAMSGDFATFMGSLTSMTGVTSDSIKSLFANVIENAQSAEQAQQMASEQFGAMVMDGVMNAMMSIISDSLMTAMVAPLLDSLMAGALASSAALTVGASAAGSAMAVGGAVGGAASAQGGAAAAGAMAAGGASAGASMASGGAAAGGAVGDVVAQAQQYIQAMGQMLRDPTVQAGIGQIGQSIGAIAADLYGAQTAASAGRGSGIMGALQSSGSGGGGGGGGGGAKAANDLGEALKKLGQTIAEEVKRLRDLTIESSEFGREYLMAQFATATAQARAGDVAALEKLPELSRSLEEIVKESSMGEMENVRMRAWLADSLEKTLNTLGLKLEDFENTDKLTVSSTGLTNSAPATATDVVAAVRTITVSGNADLLVEFRAMRAEMAELKKTAQGAERNTAGLPQMVEQFDSVTEGGNAMRSEVMP